MKKMTVSTLSARNAWFKSKTVKRSQIRIVEFVTRLPKGIRYSEKWNAAEDGDITAAISGTRLYISSNGADKIRANSDSSFMFSGDGLHYSENWNGLELIIGLDMLDMSGVTDMREMFSGCHRLCYVGDIGTWQVDNVENMHKMFSHCETLVRLDTTGWNTGHVTDMGCMFMDCNSLHHITGMHTWDTSRVTTMAWMFSGCYSLVELCDKGWTLDGWDIRQVRDMTGMFASCERLSFFRILSHWDIRNAKADDMFSCCHISDEDMPWYTASQVLCERHKRRKKK